MSDPYTPKSMEVAHAGPAPRDGRFEGLQAEASAALAYSANTLRGVRERYREAMAETEDRWRALRDELTAIDQAGTTPPGRRPATTDAAADAAEAGAEGARVRTARGDVESLGGEVATHRAALARLELAERTLSRTWRFLERGDASLVADDLGEADLAMRIVEAQEAERTRLAQEIHDGPAQALSNAIFQLDYLERIAESDPAAAAAELPALRDLLRRDLGEVRDVIHQLRPAGLDQGLGAAIEDAAERVRRLTNVTVTVQLTAPDDALDARQRTVALRVAQEALHNMRKHAAASTVVVETAVTDDGWSLEIRDDGRGFDVGAAAARGRRNFGLQFMRERAELIGARLDVRSRPDGGTVVRLVIPTGAPTGAEESR